MDKMRPDSAKYEISTRVKDIVRVLFIDDWQSESYLQHQNFSERRFQTIKRENNDLLGVTSAPAFTWLLAMCYVFLFEPHLQRKC